MFRAARVHTFGYESHYLKGKGKDLLNVHHFGKSLLGELTTSPALKDAETPIIAIGHSMGGLVIKKAFILANQDPAHHALARRFAVMYFLATPHRGANSARLLKNILKAVESRAYVADLEPNSGTIQVINDEFRHYSSHLELRSFYETQTMKYFASPIVDPESAVLGYPGEKQMPMTADHRTICKYDSRSDPNYVIIRNALASSISAIIASQTTPNITRGQVRELRQSLNYWHAYDDEYVTVKEHRLEGSCQWLASRHAFLRWRDWESGYQILWINGRPAAGKSVLASSVIDGLLDSAEACQYYFFKHGDESKSRLIECLRCLAFQMARSSRDAHSSIMQLQMEGAPLGQADEHTFWRAVFQSGMLATKRRQYWVIDGLDECPEQSVLLSSMLSGLASAVPLKILITSRKTPILEKDFASLSLDTLQSI